jgi:dihydropyrimidinase
MSVHIKAGRIVTADDDYVGDVFIEDERVSLIGESLDIQADKVLDTSGKFVRRARFSEELRGTSGQRPLRIG